MTYPLISALCPTHARAPAYLWMLEECVYWFTQQDWPNKELIIANDDPGQALICKTPGVRVLNYPTRFESLGAKYRAMLEAAKGEYAMCWEDDDVNLPHRMRQAAEHLGSDFDFWNPQSSFYQSGRDGQIHTGHPHGVCMNCSAFRAKAFRGIYPGKAIVNGNVFVASGHVNQDAIADGWAKQNLRWNQATLIAKPKQWSYVYRFGVTGNHFSGQATVENAEQVWRSQMPGVPGVYEIVPRMRLDYVALCDEAAKKAVFPAV